MNQIHLTTASSLVQAMDEHLLLGLENLVKDTLHTFAQCLNRQLGKQIEISRVFLGQTQRRSDETWWYITFHSKERIPVLTLGCHPSFLQESIDAFLQTKSSEERMLDEFDQSIALEIFTAMQSELEKQINLQGGTIRLKRGDLLEMPSNGEDLELRFDATIHHRSWPLTVHVDKSRMETYLARLDSPIQSKNIGGSYLARPVIGINAELVSNIPLTIGVELGKTKRLIKDILDFHPGTIIELDKQNGAMMEVIINGTIFAKGEIVVLEENFGVRITEIVNQSLEK